MNLYKVELLGGGTLFLDWRDVQNLVYDPKDPSGAAVLTIHFKDGTEFGVSGQLVDAVWATWRQAAGEGQPAASAAGSK